MRFTQLQIVSEKKVPGVEGFRTTDCIRECSLCLVEGFTTTDCIREEGSRCLAEDVTTTDCIDCAREEGS